MHEPRITDQDREIYDTWMHGCRAYSGTRAHRRAVKWAKKLVAEMQRSCESPYIAWSAGKDSTVLVHLICVQMGLDMPVMSLVTDLEPPGTRDYMEQWASRWEVDLRIIEPDVSFKAWLREHADEVDLSRKVVTGKTGLGGVWDKTMRRWRESSGHDGLYWGLRMDESKGRRANFHARGAVYQTKDGFWRAQPIVGWTGRDVYAYVASHDDIELMDLYRCVRLHDSPEMVRKAMCLPDSKGQGPSRGATWLRTYYPSLYAELAEILPQMSQMA